MRFGLSFYIVVSPFPCRTLLRLYTGVEGSMEKGTAQGGALHDPESGVVLPAGEELKAELKGIDNRVIPGARVLEWNVASVEVGKGAKSKLLLQGIGT
jgi:hypothetical protein